jgi:hypothetical protein
LFLQNLQNDRYVETGPIPQQLYTLSINRRFFLHSFKLLRSRWWWIYSWLLRFEGLMKIQRMYQEEEKKMDPGSLLF